MVSGTALGIADVVRAYTGRARPKIKAGWSRRYHRLI